MQRHTRGFTLIEMVVAAGITAVVLGGITVMHVRSARHEASLSDKVELFGKGRRAFAELGDELKLGVRIVQPSLGVSAPFVLFTNRENGLICYYLEKDPAAGRVGGNRLQRLDYMARDDNDRVRTMADGLEEARFTRTGESELSVRFFLKASEKDRLPLATSVKLRNYVDPIDVGPHRPLRAEARPE